MDSFHLIVLVLALLAIYSNVKVRAVHLRESRSWDALERLMRWCMVVAAVWCCVAIGFALTINIDFPAEFSVSPPPSRSTDSHR